MKFTKWQGLGNDFVVINNLGGELRDAAELAKRICDRHFGIGADGLILIENSALADFKMRIINADGTEPEMCGNGLRCAAKFIDEYDLTGKTKLTIETLAGIMEPEILSDGLIRVNMGVPRLKRSEIPVAGTDSESAQNIVLNIGGHSVTGTAVSMGNPHFVIFTEHLEDEVIRGVGPLVEEHEMFPKKTNVEFIKIIDRKNIRMRVWERGVGVTLACGTGACASAVACILAGETDNEITVKLDGGGLLIAWNGEGQPIYMTGPAIEVFTGEFN
ncbi:diaminopimelate epimerase [Elusimicrobium simillimum]|uniref:diaminopimelate epimerase n=1 Tax=Elusimicrobium simillimum TaxID=3143438 RepID=UPI003C701BEB